MPIIDKAPLLEAAESLNKYREEYSEKRQRKLSEAAKEKASLEEQVYFGAKAKREARRQAIAEYTTNLKNDLLSTAIKGIYIGALMENKALTDDGMALANSLVENYVAEKGADNILGRMEGRTYCLDMIRCCVEGTYEHILTEADDDEDEENKIEDSSDDNDSEDTSSDDNAEDESPEEENPGEDENDDDDSSDDSEPEDNDTSDDDSEDSDDEDEPKEDLPTPKVDNPKDITPSDDDEEEVDDSDDEEEELPDPETIEEPEEDKQKMMDDLAQDDDINHAVNLIANRVADAEQEFIKKNTEDKKAIEDIANKVSERIKGAESDASMSDDEAEEVKQEATRFGQRETNKLKERKISTVYEQIAMNLASTIVKDNVLRENYTSESGKLDMDSVMESVYCIYGFLETVNTLQLEKVNAEFIQKELDAM